MQQQQQPLEQAGGGDGERSDDVRDVRTVDAPRWNQEDQPGQDTDKTPRGQVI